MYRMPNTVPKQIRHVIMVAAPNILQLISCILKSSNSGSEPVSLIKFILAILCKWWLVGISSKIQETWGRNFGDGHQ